LKTKKANIRTPIPLKNRGSIIARILKNLEVEVELISSTIALLGDKNPINVIGKYPNIF